MSYANEEPLISANKSLPEMTIKGIVLALILTIVLGAANAYLGIKIGMTISASIPAAVISMGVLRWFKKSNVLENSIVQTTASAGEALVAGIAFTVPALLALHFWSNFNYIQTVAIALIGGVFGVIFTVPLRRLMLNDKTLRFPEGIAIGSVLKVSASKDISMKPLIFGGLVGGFISFAQSGIQIFSESISSWFVHNDRIYGVGFGFSPAMLAAGYIVGIYIAISVTIGMIIAWVFCLPYLSHGVAIDPKDMLDTVMSVWSHKIRYIGVGTMLIGGVWTFITLFKPLIKTIQMSMRSHREQKKLATEILRTEKDIPMRYLNWILILMAIPLFIFFYMNAVNSQLEVSHLVHLSMSVSAVIICLVFGFILAAVCAYFAGLVGSSSSPISGVTLSIVLIAALYFHILLYNKIDMHNAHVIMQASAYTILVAAIVATMGAISNDTMQDLKSGQMVGSTPWKQQVALIIGMIAAAFVIPEVLKLLFNAYGMAGVMPRPGMDPRNMLSAPQATLMASVATGVFGGKLPWDLIITGMVIGAVVILIDEIIKRKNMRMPALAVGMGIYLPFDVTSALALGGFLSYLAKTKAKKLPEKNSHSSQQNATMLACGLVAGSALMGVILAIPFVILQSSDALAIMPVSLTWLADILGVLSLIALVYWIYHTATRKK
jgi:putative OPT family oligopeptide transporter